MTSVANTLIPPGPWTVDDLDRFPKSPTVRYELIDGALLVTSEATLQHQRVLKRLAAWLDLSVPDDLEVFLPIDVRLSAQRQVAPDISVVRRSDTVSPRLSGLPVLVVEVQSPSTWAVDLTLKRQAFEDAGIASYWLVDPDLLTIRVLELERGEYVVRGTVTEGSPLSIKIPWPMALDVAALSRP